MIKQEIMIDYADFLATVLEGKGPETLPLEGPLIDAYLYSSVLAYLRPDWFQSEKFEPAFADLCSQLSAYREKAGRDAFFSSIAKSSKIVVESGTCKSFDVGEIRCCDELNRGVIPPQDIGLHISKETKDRKFVMRTMSKFLRWAFPKPKEAPMVLSTPKIKPAVAPLQERISSMLDSVVQYPGLSAAGILPMRELPFQQLNTGEKRDFMYEMWRYITILMPETPYSDAILPENMRWSYMEEENFREVDIDSLFARDATCLNPEPMVCYLCRPEFRRLLILGVDSTMSKFLRWAFPKPKEAPMVLSTPKIKPAVAPLQERISSMLDSVVQYPGLSAAGILPMRELPFQQLNTGEKRDFMYEMWRYITILMPETPYSDAILPENMRWSYMEEENFREVDIDSLFARDATCLNPEPMVCYLCRPEFRRLLSTIFYVRSSQLPVTPLYSRNSEDRSRYFTLHDTVLAPIMEGMDEEIQFQVNIAGNALMGREKMKIQMDKAEAENMALQAQLNEMSKRTAAPELEQELSKLKEELVAVRQKYEVDLERTKADLSKLQEKNKQLSENLKASQASYNEINEQYINLLWEDGVFLDEDDLREQDAPPAPSGVRERIGDEAYEKLAGKRLVVVGGHANTQRVLRELFPNWRFFAVDEKLTDSMTAVDAVAILARYTSHKNVEQARAAVKSADIPMLTISYNGPTSICQAIAKMI